MKENWLDLYQNSVTNFSKIKVNSLYVLKWNFQTQYTVLKIEDSDVFILTRNGTEIVKNIRWCIENLREVMRL